MIVGIRVEAEDIRTGKTKHCNSSYFTMVAKDSEANNTQVPGLILSNNDELRRFCNCLKQIALKKDRNLHDQIFDYQSPETLLLLQKHNVKIELA